MSLFRRKIMMAAKANQYTDLSYLTSDGSSLMSTGVYADENTRLEIKIRILQASCRIGGAKDSDSENSFSIMAVNNKIRFDLSNAMQWSSAYTVGEAYTLIIENGYQAILDENGDAIGEYSRSTELSISPTLPIVIGGFVRYSDSSTSYAVNDFLGVNIYKQGTLVLDWSPKRNKQDQVGMYDSVSNTFTIAPTWSGTT